MVFIWVLSVCRTDVCPFCLIKETKKRKKTTVLFSQTILKIGYFKIHLSVTVSRASKNLRVYSLTSKDFGIQTSFKLIRNLVKINLCTENQLNLRFRVSSSTLTAKSPSIKISKSYVM